MRAASAEGSSRSGGRFRGKGSFLFPMAMSVSIIMGLAACGGSTPDFAEWQPAYEMVPANRAPWADAQASSMRMGLFPVYGKSDLLPFKWPILLPRFAQDGSPLTRWASKPNECPFLEFDLVRPSEEPVRVERVVLNWGTQVPRAFSLDTSEDGETWSPAFQGKPARDQDQVIGIDASVLCRHLRIAALNCPVGQGMSLINVSVFPRADDVLPPAASSISAEAVGPYSARIGWDPTDRTYLYRIYRLSSADGSPDPSNHVGSTRFTHYEDGRLQPDSRYYYRVVPESFSGNTAGATTGISVQTPSLPKPSPFQIRGVVEGFYNQSWSHPDRMEMIRFMGTVQMNIYVYAPKNDPYQREFWRTPYPDKQLALFRELIKAGVKHGVSFCYGISPGWDFNWNDPGEPDEILKKYRVFYDMGARAFCLQFDDVPDTDKSNAQTAAQQVALVEQLLGSIKSWGADPVTFIFVPTIYARTIDQLEKKNPDFVAYLRGLSRMPEQVFICWTGPDSPYAPSITLEQAQAHMDVLGRKVTIWDNFPVGDIVLLFEPFCGPYRNRAPDLAEAVSGVLSNPSNYPLMSKVPLFTVAQYLNDPLAYDPDKSWDEAVDFVGGAGGSDALGTVVGQFYGHPLIPPTNVESRAIQDIVTPFWQEFDGPEYPGAYAAAMRDQFEAFAAIEDTLDASVEDYALRAELGLPARKLAIYGEAGLVAMDILELIHQGEKEGVRTKLRLLRGKLLEAGLSPWKVGENHMSVFVLFYPYVHVDVIGGFLRDVVRKAEHAL